MKIKLDTSVSELPKIGEKLSKRLGKLGLHSVADLLAYYPFRYEDFSTITKIADVKPDTHITIRGTVNLIANKRAFRRRMYLTECLLSDDTGSIKAIWFNQPFITKMIKQGDTVYLSGKAEYTSYGLQLTSPSYEKIKKEQIHTARIVPIYSLTENLTEKQIRYLIKLILPLAKQIPDWLPKDFLKKYNLIDLAKAVHEVHFPSDQVSLDQAIRRLKFNELFLIQLRVQNIRRGLAELTAPGITFRENETKKFVRSLPFQLTASQKATTWEILKAIQMNKPMNRLLEGDVGSGKTVVAAIVVLNVVKNGFQAALMAPTEILATQHYKTINELLGGTGITVSLLTRSMKKYKGKETTQKKLLEHISNGNTQIIIGTHALIQEKVTFDNLGLVIIDEQHRFGVDQRKTLKQKSAEFVPHLLSMTATPIPRSLALTLYGDLDLSIITQMPKNRKKIITKIVPPQKRKLAYNFIRDEISNGRQVFVICPLIEESDKLGVKAATAEYEKLRKNVFPDLSVGLIHGKLKAVDKDSAMNRFAENKIKILVATAVVEVGIDVPNASVMMIEGAERFGLAQLHQFRGRVGRADHQSYCFIFSDSDSDKTIQRLDALVTAKNGFELAERDLEFRGPGEVYGVRQSGFPELKIAKLTDLDLITLTKKAAVEFFKRDPDLKTYHSIKEKILSFAKNTHLE